MSCEEKNEPRRCFECPFIGYNNRLAYYPNYYCKINGQEIQFSEKFGWERMAWCPERNDNQ